MLVGDVFSFIHFLCHGKFTCLFGKKNQVMLTSIPKLELLKRITRPEPSRVDHLVSQPNLTHLLASRNSNLTWPTSGWLTGSLNYKFFFQI